MGFLKNFGFEREEFLREEEKDLNPQKPKKKDESVNLDRRQFLKKAGQAGLAVAGAAVGMNVLEGVAEAGGARDKVVNKHSDERTLEITKPKNTEFIGIASELSDAEIEQISRSYKVAIDLTGSVSSQDLLNESARRILESIEEIEKDRKSERNEFYTFYNIGETTKVEKVQDINDLKDRLRAVINKKVSHREFFKTASNVNTDYINVLDEMALKVREYKIQNPDGVPICLFLGDGLTDAPNRVQDKTKKDSPISLDSMLDLTSKMKEIHKKGGAVVFRGIVPVKDIKDKSFQAVATITTDGNMSSTAILKECLKNSAVYSNDRELKSGVITGMAVGAAATMVLSGLGAYTLKQRHEILRNASETARETINKGDLAKEKIDGEIRGLEEQKGGLQTEIQRLESEIKLAAAGILTERDQLETLKKANKEQAETNEEDNKVASQALEILNTKKRELEAYMRGKGDKERQLEELNEQLKKADDEVQDLLRIKEDQKGILNNLANEIKKGLIAAEQAQIKHQELAKVNGQLATSRGNLANTNILVDQAKAELEAVEAKLRAQEFKQGLESFDIPSQLSEPVAVIEDVNTRAIETGNGEFGVIKGGELLVLNPKNGFIDNRGHINFHGENAAKAYNGKKGLMERALAQGEVFSSKIQSNGRFSLQTQFRCGEERGEQVGIKVFKGPTMVSSKKFTDETIDQNYQRNPYKTPHKAFGLLAGGDYLESGKEENGELLLRDAQGNEKESIKIPEQCPIHGQKIDGFWFDRGCLIIRTRDKASGTWSLYAFNWSQEKGILPESAEWSKEGFKTPPAVQMAKEADDKRFFYTDIETGGALHVEAIPRVYHSEREQQ